MVYSQSTSYVVSVLAIAPAVSINGKVYPLVEVKQVEGIINDYRAREAA